MEINMEQIVERMLEDSIKTAIRSVITKHSGHGIEGDIKAVILKTAQGIMENDEELQGMIREALIYWIRQK